MDKASTIPEWQICQNDYILASFYIDSMLFPKIHKLIFVIKDNASHYQSTTP